MSQPKSLLIASFFMALSGAYTAAAQTSAVANLTVLSGNGQAACACLSSTLVGFQPIAVKATDARGNPVAGATVNWSIASGQVTLGPGSSGAATATTTTAADGSSSQPINLTVYGNQYSAATPYLVSTIQAAANTHTVLFTETESLIYQGSSVIRAGSPTYNGANLSQATLSASTGATLATPIQLQVAGFGVAGAGVPNISVRILNSQTSPVLSCDTTVAGGIPYADPGSVLSDPHGNVTCYPKFSGSGTGQFYVLIGAPPATSASSALYLQVFGPYTFTSVTGAPAAVEIISGNNQVGNTGQPLQPLVAQLVDASGNPAPGQTMNWSVVPAGAVVLNVTRQQTDNNGEVSMTVSLTSAASAGTLITVALASNPNISATFQETVYGALTSMIRVSGDGQTAQAGTTFASPLVVEVRSAFGPVPNYPVQYQVTGPVGIVGGNTAGTNAYGQASVTVKAGTSTGTATVMAIAGALIQTFTLTVTSSPVGPTPISIAIVSGSPQTAVVNGVFSAPLVVQVNGNSGPVGGVLVSYSSNGPVYLSSGAAITGANGQAAVSVTAGGTTGPATVTASISGGYSVTFNLTVSPPGPNLSASSFLNAASRQVGALSPCSLAIVSASGLTPDGAADYSPAPIFGRLPKAIHGLSVTIGGVPAPIVSVAMGAANPEVTFQVPCEVTPAASVPIVVNVNGGGNAATNIPILALSPGIFQTLMSDGTSRAVVVRSDGSFADIGGADQYNPSNPARQNEYVRIYATGLGPTMPPVATDSIQNPNADLYGTTANVAATVQAAIVGFGALQVISARQAPDLIGVYEVQVAIPASAPVGNNQQITIGVVPAGSGVVSSLPAPIPIAQ